MGFLKHVTMCVISLAGRIDHAHHDGNAFRALYDLLALDKAVAKALEIVNKGEN